MNPTADPDGGRLPWWIPREQVKPDAIIPNAVRLVRGEGSAAVVRLDPMRTYHVGRDLDSDLRFDAEQISRLHAVLYFCPEIGAWAFCDLGSRYGSVLLDERGSRRRNLEHHEPVPVVAGSIVQLAGEPGQRAELIIEDAESTAAAPGWRSTAARSLEQAVLRASRHRLPMFLLGPSGAGKTYAAERIHELSRAKAFVSINCGQLSNDPGNLASELLGHVRGAFTGALGDRIGKLKHADGGTLFLDEVEALRPEAQVFLLDLLEGKGDLTPLGAPPSKAFPRPSFRLISASKQRLDESPLRKDLAQRLAAGDILLLPTLEQRREDVPLFVARFVDDLAREAQLEVRLAPAVDEFLAEREWPGQVRELQATVRTVALRRWADLQVEGRPVTRVELAVSDFAEYLRDRSKAFGAAPEVSPTGKFDAAVPRPPAPSAAARKRPADFTREDLEGALRAAGGNKTRAAAALGVSINTLRKKMEELGL